MSANSCVFNNSDDDDDELIGMRQAFQIPIIPENFDPSVLPSTGEEYLQHVIFESKKFADVCVAQRVDAATRNALCDSEILLIKPSLSESSFDPSDDWKAKRISEFVKLRNLVLDIRLRGKNSKMVMHKIPKAGANNVAWRKFIAEHEPLLSTILLLRQIQLQEILQVLVQTHSNLPFTVEEGAWIFAICAALDHPLSREACGELRDIARKCSRDRKLKTDANDKELKMMNLLITLVVKYFKQQDLEDYERGTDGV